MFDSTRWELQGKYRTAGGLRAHTAMDETTGATVLIVEAEGAEIGMIRAAQGPPHTHDYHGASCLACMAERCPTCRGPLVPGRDDLWRPCWPCAQRGSR